MLPARRKLMEAQAQAQSQSQSSFGDGAAARSPGGYPGAERGQLQAGSPARGEITGAGYGGSSSPSRPGDGSPGAMLPARRKLLEAQAASGGGGGSGNFGGLSSRSPGRADEVIESPTAGTGGAAADEDGFEDGYEYGYDGDGGAAEVQTDVEGAEYGGYGDEEDEEEGMSPRRRGGAPAGYEEHYDYEDNGDGGSQEGTGRDGYKPSVDNTETWKQFGTETEAGRLLRKLYGDHSRPQIAYPKVHVRPSSEPRPAFVPAGADKRAAKAPAPQVNVPKPGYTRMPAPAPIDRFHYRRRDKAACEAASRQIVEDRDKYQPPATKAVATEMEKRRLQLYFTLKGGKCLPEELTMAPIEGNIPLHLLTTNPKRVPARRAPPTPPERIRSKTEEMFDEVAREIEERAKFLDEMTALGTQPKNIAQIRQEISARTQELMRLNAIIEEEQRARSRPVE